MFAYSASYVVSFRPALGNYRERDPLAFEGVFHKLAIGINRFQTCELEAPIAHQLDKRWDLSSLRNCTQSVEPKSYAVVSAF